MDTEAERDRVVARHGPWVGFNTQLAPGVYTMEHDRIGVPEFLVQSIVQGVGDVAKKPLDQLRVLDLGCHEGGYAIEFGLHGAEVLGVEGREPNIEKARFTARALKLGRLTFEHGDIRDISEERLGRFDVVLCLGVLYHLTAADAVQLVARCYQLTDHLLVIRSAVGLAPDFDQNINGVRYRGRRYTENQREVGASIGNDESIFPTRTTLLNLLGHVGFSSVHEVLNPAVPELDQLRDTVSYVAVRNERLTARAMPTMGTIAGEMRHSERRRPLWIWSAANPQQGLYWRVRERLFHTFARVVFQARATVDEWRLRDT